MGLVLYITYSWSSNSPDADLDGGVSFLMAARGLYCFPKDFTYLSYGGDADGSSGNEEFNVNLGKAFVDGKWIGSTAVQLRAGWLNLGGQATVTMSTKRFMADGTSVNDNNAISFVVNPINRPPEACASPVADATVIIGPGGIVTITVTY